jgi:hypothetical protein
VREREERERGREEERREREERGEHIQGSTMGVATPYPRPSAPLPTKYAKARLVVGGGARRRSGVYREGGGGIDR